MGRDLPTGTVTFVFTDIEGSTSLVQALGGRWPSILEQHDALLRSAIEGWRGTVVRTEGDAFFAVFTGAVEAVSAAVDIQRGLADHPWPDDAVIRVRIGIHTGVGVAGGEDYVGLDVHRAARIAATAHGGQIVISEATSTLVERHLPEEITLQDLGKHRLKDLTDREAIYQVDAEGLQSRFPPLRTLERVAHNLPVQVTSFVGREQEIAEAVERLRTARIVTLLGPGGTGKTRLSLQVAAECAEHFGDGTFFVPLAAVSDPELIPSTILGALGVPASTRKKAPREHLVDFFSDKSALLVLDNFEQIVDGGAIVADLVRHSPESRVLVTSRIPLRIAGEQEMPISPLAVTSAAPGDVVGTASIPAVKLFVDRATAVRPDFQLTEDNVDHVVQLVRHLDGLPLAIELVVSQLRMLPVKVVLERLDPSRLGGSARDAPERHRTLWNAISWSVEDLAPEHRRLLARLSVFVGGARLEEVEAVCDDLDVDAIEGLGVLIERSLLVADTSADEVRFRWLRVIREYATQLLDGTGTRAEVEALHASAYVKLAEAAFEGILGRERRRWVEALDRDHDNLRAALNWAIENGEADVAFRLSWALWRFWQTRGHLHEAAATVERVLAMQGGEERLRVKAMEASGGIAWWRGDMEGADRIYVEVLERQRALGDPSEIANALYNAGLTQAYGYQEGEAARSLFHEAEEIYRELGDVGGLANVHWGLGSLAYIGQAVVRQSRPLLEQAVAEYREAGNVFGEGWAHFELAAHLIGQGDAADAVPHLETGLGLLWDSRDYSAVVMFVMLFAWVAHELGDAERAARLAGAAYRLRDRSGVDIMSIEVNQIEGMQIEDMEALEGDLAAAYQEGRAMGYEEAVTYALGGD